MRIRFVVVVVQLVLFLAPRSARAEDVKKPILVLESHVGERSAKLDKVIGQIDDALETHGFAARPATIMRVAGKAAVPRPGRLDLDLTQAQIAQHFNEAWAKFGNAEWVEARKALTNVLEEVHRNPAAVVSDTTNLDLTFRAYVALAVCHQRLLDAGAAGRTMIEAIRIFPSRPVSRADAWGKEGEKLYIDYSKQAQAMGRGRLAVAAGNSETQIFIEGQMRGMGHASLADLVPGTYRVYLRTGPDIGRQYEVQVMANDEAYLRVDADLDNALWVSEAWVGFQFATEAARGNEAKFAGELARRWTGDGSVVVLAAAQDKGRTVLDGVRYRNGLEVRRARIYTDASDPGGPTKLAQFLVDGTSTDGIEVLRTDADARPPSDIARRSRWPARVVLGAGVATFVASGIGFVVSKDDPLVEFNGRDYSVYASLGGSAVVGAGLYLWLTQTKSTKASTAIVFSAGVASLLAGTVMIATDEDADRNHLYYRNTSTPGFIIGGAGAVLTGVGTWLLLRERRGIEATSSPVVFVENGRGYVGVSGAF